MDFLMTVSHMTNLWELWQYFANMCTDMWSQSQEPPASRCGGGNRAMLIGCSHLLNIQDTSVWSV